jgi:ribonuclease VapC
MTLDSSALLAILFAEAGHLDLIDRILEADVVRVGAPTLVETTLVLAGRRPTVAAAATVESLIRELGLSVVAFGEREHEHAVDAFLRFGRGRHAAGLNFGDCLAYGAAAAANDSLLFVGGDFAKTDITPA